MVLFKRFDLSCVVLVFSVATVSCQVQGFVGGSVLLPCLYEGSDLPQEVTVFWRDKDDSRVLDITQNTPDLSAQSSKFRNRVQTFPKQYKKGNFSIVLTSLQRSDSGTYTCDVLQVDFEQRVMLSVSERDVASTPPPDGAAAVTSSLLLTLLSALLSLWP